MLMFLYSVLVNHKLQHKINLNIKLKKCIALGEILLTSDEQEFHLIKGFVDFHPNAFII